MAKKVKIKNLGFQEKIRRGHILLGLYVILCWVATVTLFDRYLSSAAEEFRENFSYQNQAELAASDIFKLSLKLNIVSQNPLISCLSAQRAGHVFFESYCAQGFMSKPTQVGGATKDSVIINLNFAYPRQVQFLLVAILILEALSLAFIFQKIREFQFRAEAVRRARQMAHDIRSPLTALTVLSEKLSQNSPQEARLLASASKQINGIAEGMLTKTKTNISPPDNQQEVKLQPHPSQQLKALIENLIESKKLEYRDRSNINVSLYWLVKENRNLNFNPAEFAPIISNLINNSFEATTHGFITVTVEADHNRIILEVRDSGKGMSSKVLENLGQEGFSYEKANGNGLALSHAMRTLKSWQGNLSIFSQPNLGTTIKIALQAVN